MKFVSTLKIKLTKIGEAMIGSIEKGIAAAKLATPPTDSYEGVNLSVLPKYIAYKAALIKEQLTLRYVLIIVLIVFGVYSLAKQFEVSSLHEKLREKEYILAPGVLDFTTAAPQSVPDSYVNDAVTDFLSNLGNINPSNIDEQFQNLTRFMSDELRVKFEMQMADWIQQVKTDGVTEVLTITQKEIIANKNGEYKVTALGRADFYTNHQYLGYEDQVIEMMLKLSPPESGKRWYLKIISLSQVKAETFNRSFPDYRGLFFVKSLLLKELNIVG